VIPVGTSLRSQHLVKVISVSESEYIEEDLGGVRFVPLIGAAGWEDEKSEKASRPEKDETARREAATLPELINDSSEHFSDINSANLDGLLDRISDCRLVLLGDLTNLHVAASKPYLSKYLPLPTIYFFPSLPSASSK